MKTILVTVATLALGFIVLPQKAEARSHCNTGHSVTYVSGHASCGCAIHQRKVIVGYDHLRRAIYRYFKVPMAHRCRNYQRTHYSYSRYHKNYHRSRISRRHGSRGYATVSYRTYRGGARTCR